MAEWGVPFPGTSVGDAGPYAVGGAAAPGWWDAWHTMMRAGGRLTQTALADIGVFYCVDDQLECTVAADTISIDVDEGASLIDGTFHWNDTDPVNVPIPAAAAGLNRIDLVVVRKNYSAVTTYTPGGGAPTVGPRECRITVIRGSEAGSPVAPTVTQDTTRATYWDIPLCTVQVNDAGTLSSLTDLREYVDAETKTFFIQALSGYNTTDVTGIDLVGENTATQPALILPDNKLVSVYGRDEVPVDFISDMTIQSLVFPAASGDMLTNTSWGLGGCSESRTTHTGGGGNSAIAVTVNVYNCINSETLTNVTAGDFISIESQRLGNNPADTVNNTVRFLGWRVEYLGWKK